jgi:hypothetical protein
MERRQLLVSCLVLAIFIVPKGYAQGQAVSSNGSNPKTTTPHSIRAETEPVEIAEGEYSIFKDYGGVGPVDAEIYNFHENWSISRTEDGNYEVEGTRSFESPKDFPKEITFVIRLSPQLQLIEAREYTSLIWVPRSAPVTCVFFPRQLECSANGKDPRENPDLSLFLDNPYAFSWPLSAFSLATLTLQSDHHPGRSMDVQFVDIEQCSNDVPLMPVTTNGKLRFIGPDKVVVAGKTWDADKFELQTFISPLPRKSVLWVSKGGLLLELEAKPEIGPKGRLELTRFEQESPLSVFP